MATRHHHNVADQATILAYQLLNIHMRQLHISYGCNYSIAMFDCQEKHLIIGIMFARKDRDRRERRDSRDR